MQTTPDIKEYIIYGPHSLVPIDVEGSPGPWPRLAQLALGEQQPVEQAPGPPQGLGQVLGRPGPGGGGLLAGVAPMPVGPPHALAAGDLLAGETVVAQRVGRMVQADGQAPDALGLPERADPVLARTLGLVLGAALLAEVAEAARAVLRRLRFEVSVCSVVLLDVSKTGIFCATFVYENMKDEKCSLCTKRYRERYVPPETCFCRILVCSGSTVPMLMRYILCYGPV